MDVKPNPTLDKIKQDEIKAEREIARRRASALAADASLRLEGLSASQVAKEIGEQWVSGKISDDDLIERTKAQLLLDFSE